MPLTTPHYHWQGAIGIFAKTPALSPVKTRLARTIGTHLAEAFYDLSVKATAEVLQHLQKENMFDIHPYWALAEQTATQLAQWQNFNALWTGEGDLGARLHTVYQQLFSQHDYVLLMGTDCPQISPALVQHALVQLHQQQDTCVIGPADDGGFYLLAAARALDKNIWLPVEYSSENTLAQLVHNLNQEGISQQFLATQNDVDTLADLQHLQQVLSASTTLLPKQIILLDWITNHLKAF